MTTRTDATAHTHALWPSAHTTTIRRAAAVVRDRARPVVHFTAPWSTRVRYGDNLAAGVEVSLDYGTTHPLAGHLATVADYGGLQLADHLALWTPPLALAIADLLDVAAASDDLPSLWQALAVARTVHATREATQ